MNVEYHLVLKLLSMALVGGNEFWLPVDVAVTGGKLSPQEDVDAASCGKRPDLGWSHGITSNILDTSGYSGSVGCGSC